MATDERNFRSTYYEKVGCRSVEEKKSLNILLKDKPLNRTKLKQFCLSFTVPAAQRSLLWNLILGILPTYPESREYVLEQRRAVYEDTKRAAKVMHFVDDNTPKAKLFYAMWLLENRKIRPDCFFVQPQDSGFVNIADALLQVFDNFVEIYWITKEFYQSTVEITGEFSKLQELTYTLLEKEDYILYRHMEKYDILNNIPLKKWYTTCFAGLISGPALMRVWDKICGGSKKIIVFVLLVLFKSLRMALVLSTNSKEFQQIIETKREDQDDLIVNKAIESWQNNKNHNEFMVHLKNN